uniref:Uncharacterized protein n=1 Tax=Eutreptiella gymnastica TaxID=73025 RepID=A0A7S4CV65_9EUGL
MHPASLVAPKPAPKPAKRRKKKEEHMQNFRMGYTYGNWLLHMCSCTTRKQRRVLNTRGWCSCNFGLFYKGGGYFFATDWEQVVLVQWPCFLGWCHHRPDA